jgi:hypothetical protein
MVTAGRKEVIGANTCGGSNAQEVTQMRPVYEAPTLLAPTRLAASRQGRALAAGGLEVNNWIIVVMLLAVVIIYYGSLGAFCVAVCGYGKVQTCAAEWGIWAKVVCRP